MTFLSTDHIWQQSANQYWPSTNALKCPTIPAGLYQYEKSIAGWFLVRTGDRYEFPYKIYGNHDHIVSRIKAAWTKIEGNLGVLLNGIKGTGKTITAQNIANWAVDAGIPVLVVRHPIPLADVLERFHQEVLVIFDEFEKSHSDKDDQQALLTALDGMARNAHRRLFVFTTNEKTVDTNFIDRPSRIRYCWEFDRLSDDVLEALLTDLLDPDLAPLRASIVTYLQTRKVLSIDVAKTVINEVNMFRQDPSEFAHILNLTEMDALGFTLEILDSNHNPVRTLTPYFTPPRAEMNRLRASLVRSGREKFLNDIASNPLQFSDRSRRILLEFHEGTDNPSDWVCHVQIDPFETWLRKFPKVIDIHHEELLWIDKKPDNWEIPEWAKILQKGEKFDDDDEDEEEGSPRAAFRDWVNAESIYGSKEPADVLVRITPNFESKPIRLTEFVSF